LENLPLSVRSYLAHTEGKLSIRAVARVLDCAPSTVLRQVRRIESQRDDPLLDEALDHAARAVSQDHQQIRTAEDWATMVGKTSDKPIENSELINREARRILRRLCEKDAFLAVAGEMDKAVVMRETVPGKHTRTAVMDREVAHQFALLDWIECRSAGRIAKYEISHAGRSALKRLLEEDRQARMAANGFAERPSPFAAQHQEFGERMVPAPDGSGQQRVRFNLAESPLTVLGRKRDRKGEAYLSEDLILAGERLREDFELAQMGQRVTQNWASFLAPQDQSSASAGRGPAEGPAAARKRVHDALSDLGPGLSDVAFRVCCFLEGLEAAEKRLGWSARSGKVVLRIALQRLAQYYGIRERARPLDLAG